MIESRLRERKYQSLSTLRLHEPISDVQWGIFYTLQVLDVFTTYKGLQYDCVVEINPIIGERPSLNKMIFTKVAILTPAIRADMKKGTVDRHIMSEINFLMSVVIMNNYEIWQDSTKKCNKI